MVAVVDDPLATLADYFRRRQLCRPRRLDAAVKPIDAQLRANSCGVEIHMYCRGHGIAIRKTVSGTSLDAASGLQADSAGERVKAILPHIAQSPAAKVVPSPPDERQVSMVESPKRCRAKPHVPVQAWWNRVGLRRRSEAL